MAFKTAENKTVYIGLTGDFIHPGIINIIEKASSLGRLIVGCLTEAAISDFKALPYLNYDQRKNIISKIVGVSKVVPQHEWSYKKNILDYKPDYFVHGDDWKRNPLQSYLRDEVIEALGSYGGELIEVPFTEGISKVSLENDYHLTRASTDLRRGMLRRLIDSKNVVRVMEAHSPISALIAEKSHFEKDGQIRFFDAFWSSSLTDSTEMGRPDIEALDISKRSENINDIFNVTSKPLIMDLDTGGLAEHFAINVANLERIGVSAVIIEDKTGLKKNSLFGTEVKQTQDTIQNFSAKIKLGKQAQASKDFMIIARIESLILEKGMSDALQRARSYVAAGADGIMIHSRKSDPSEILEFCSKFRDLWRHIPLVVVPSSFNSVTASELGRHGVNIVIYANQLMRASYKAMAQTAESILKHDCSSDVEHNIMSIKDILELIPGTK